MDSFIHLSGYTILGIVGLLFLAYAVFVAVLYVHAFVYGMLVSWGVINVDAPDMEGPPHDAWPPPPRKR